MRVIDRLQTYLSFKGITAYAFEHTCEIANGYLKKQVKGKGTVGSDILERIHEQYTDLSLLWLLTGNGEMIEVYAGQELHEDETAYKVMRAELLQLLREQIAILEASNADKDKIISMLEQQLGEYRTRNKSDQV